MTYLETIDDMSRLGRFGMKLGTERTRAILDRLGAPDRGLKGALIAGTNGKGSTGVCLAAIWNGPLDDDVQRHWGSPPRPAAIFG